MTPLVNFAFSGFLLALFQTLAALPWLFVLAPELLRSTRGRSQLLSVLGMVLGGGTVLLGGLLYYIRDPGRLAFYGRLYGSALHIQLAIDFFIVVLAVLLPVWPRGGAVALAAFREGLRQPMFWLIVVVTLAALVASMVIPYFTFGDEFKMMASLGFDMIMLAAVLFAVLAASMSIHEEIEGRTAVTLMSKPVTRRQFLLGKFLGILLAAWAMTSILGWGLNWAMYIKPYFDPLDTNVDPLAEQAKGLLAPLANYAGVGLEGTAFARGALEWLGEALARQFGLALGFGQVMVLVAIASALATRLPMVVNLVICLVIYFLGHLAPVLVRYSASLGGENTPLRLVGFLAQVFDVLLPALEFFNMGPAIIRDSPLEFWPFVRYVASVQVYAVLYTAIALLFGLILFEDRDLA
jgi:ABC-type transport system involved in multi-copper enzyme maturation permease subunit